MLYLMRLQFLSHLLTHRPRLLATRMPSALPALLVGCLSPFILRREPLPLMTFLHNPLSQPFLVPLRQLLPWARSLLLLLPPRLLLPGLRCRLIGSQASARMAGSPAITVKGGSSAASLLRVPHRRLRRAPGACATRWSACGGMWFIVRIVFV
jgi:hypothetical protein